MILAEQDAYLAEKIDAVAALIDEGYGNLLIEQLIIRLQTTAAEYESELQDMVQKLKRNADAQEELLGRIRKRDLRSSKPGMDEVGEEEITEWEKRLARLERSAE